MGELTLSEEYRDNEWVRECQEQCRNVHSNCDYCTIEKKCKRITKKLYPDREMN